MQSIPNQESLPELPAREPDAHKGAFGKLMIVATSPGMTGAGVLAARAALRSGAGLVTLAVPEGLLPVVGAQLTSAMSMPLPETPEGVLSEGAVEPLLEALAERTVLAIGPGLGRAEGTRRLVTDVMARTELPVVADADALIHLASDPLSLARRSAPTVLTPHPGEMARLCGTTTAAVQDDRVKVARRFASRHGVVVLLKGNQTVITNGLKAFVNETGNPGMATGGSGDVLTGVVAALLGQGLAPMDAARLAAHVHGRAGDLAADSVGQVGLVADDLVDLLPAAFRELEGTEG